jgi:biotin-(acetyl-CoA carboxylase) ligase
MSNINNIIITFNEDVFANNFSARASNRFRVIFQTEVDSTMNCPEVLPQYAEPYTVYLAGRQTKGAGQRGSWVTGENDIAMTIVFPQGYRRGAVDIAPGLAVVRALKKLAPAIPDLALKWPNDVYTREGGRKLCGILRVLPEDTERIKDLCDRGYRISGKHFLVGMGINVSSDITRQVGLRGMPTSLENLSGRRFAREEVLAYILNELDEIFEEILSDEARFLSAAQTAIWTESDGTCLLGFVDKRPEVRVRLLNLLPAGFRVQSCETNVEAIYDYAEVERFCPPWTVEF